MNVKLPLSRRMQSLLSDHLVSRGCDLFQAAQIIDYINANPSSFRVSKVTFCRSLRKSNFWLVYFHDRLIFTHTLFEFLKSQGCISSLKK